MRRNRSLPPNKQPRNTMAASGSKLRSASMAPPPDCRPMIRDVKSKAFVSQAVTSLVEFLDSSDYPNDISTRILQSPNAKEVFSIFEHLVRQVDPLYRLERSGLKVEEICASTLRALGYPYTLSKQYWATPGAPHAWPFVLAALDWLRQEVVDLNELTDSCYMFKYDDEQDKEQEPLGKLLYEISLSEYQAHLQGMQLDEAVIEGYQQRMLQIHGYVAFGEIRQLEARVRELETDLTEASDLDAHINALETQCTDLNAKIERMLEAETRTETRIKQIEPELQKRTTEKSTLESQKDELQKQLNLIKKKVAEQEAAGYGSLTRETLMLTERYNARLKAKAELINETEQVQLEFSRREGKIAPALDAFNRLISSIRAPGFESVAKDCDLRIRTYHAGFDMTTDLPAVAKAAENNMEKFRSAVSDAEQRLNNLIQDRLEMENAIEKLDLTDAHKQVTELQEQLERFDGLLQTEDSTAEALNKELMEKRLTLSMQAEQLRTEKSALEDRLSVLKEAIVKENRTRLSYTNFLEEVHLKMGVLISRLEGMQQQKTLCQQMWQARVDAMRAQLQRSTNRIQSRVEDALKDLNELSLDSD